MENNKSGIEDVILDTEQSETVRSHIQEFIEDFIIRFKDDLLSTESYFERIGFPTHKHNVTVRPSLKIMSFYDSYYPQATLSFEFRSTYTAVETGQRAGFVSIIVDINTRDFLENPIRTLGFNCFDIGVKKILTSTIPPARRSLCLPSSQYINTGKDESVMKEAEEFVLNWKPKNKKEPS